MKSYMLLISFIGLFTCSFNIAAMGGPEATYLPLNSDEEGETTFEGSLEKGIAGLPQELQEVVIIKTLDSILKEPLPTEKADLNAFVSRFVQLLPNPLLSLRNRKYFLNRLAHKYFLTFGRHLKVPDWYLIKYFGESGKQYTKEEMLTLGKNVLDYSFSLPERLELIERLDLKKIKVIDGELDLSGLRLNNLYGLLKIPNINTVTMLWLDNNQLKELPKEIANLHNLQRLWLSDNQLKEFPKEIAKLHNLQELFLHDNQLKELPKEIANLHNLQELELRNNQYLKEQQASIRRMLPKVKIEF